LPEDRAAAARRWGWLLIALLLTHIALALLALQAVFVFVEMAWRVVAGHDEVRALLAAHQRQFRALRLIQGVLWLLTAGVLAAWIGRTRAALSPRGGESRLRSGSTPASARPIRRPRAGRASARRAWWWSSLVAAAAADSAARLLALASGGPLDLGLAMQLLLAALLLSVAAACVGIAVVLEVDHRLAPPGPSGPRIPS
jgi:hypothetical protein